ncbi:potassium channel family protein [Paraliobacillus salinarum]|uniref:potassium channel family protein n=1 Tax=Paraliobacillus salinarum TaxID=1158996 RepID=UPI0015F48FAB|nr:potassium channel family protein [Paraliobacillus salinarum]
MAHFFVGAAIIFIGVNLYYFFMNKTYRKSYFSTALFFKLFFVLIGITFGFSVLYYALAQQDIILVESISNRKPIDHSYSNLLYFSGVTILSIGYGDMLPVGPARFFSIIEAAIGVLLPTAYFLKALDRSKKENDE